VTPAEAAGTGPPWAADWDVGATVRPGATVAFGGVGTSRKSLGLAWALVRAGVRDLRVVAFLGSVEVELLLAAGAVAELNTAGVSVEGVGLAPRYRRAREEGSVRVVEWSEGSLYAALDAAARGLPSLPCTTSPESDVVRRNPNLRVVDDPFTGAATVVARAVRPDLALLHVPSADGAGNLFIDGDAGIDPVLACASAFVVVTAEERTTRPAADAAISRIWVDVLLERPLAAWPTACYPRSRADLDALRGWVSTRGEPMDQLDPGVQR